MHDGWIVLRGKVYNLSPYLAYHPGGESILRGVLGKDATQLYDKYHRWVNEEKYVFCCCMCCSLQTSHFSLTILFVVVIVV